MLYCEILGNCKEKQHVNKVKPHVYTFPKHSCAHCGSLLPPSVVYGVGQEGVSRSTRLAVQT